MEGIDDAHDGAEEADEGSDGADAGQPRQALLHGGEGFAGGGLSGALERGDVAGRAESAGLAPVGLVDLVEDIDEGAGLELLADGRDFLEAVGLAEGAEEAMALRARAAEARPTCRE